jgi:hypothetical protein
VLDDVAQVVAALDLVFDLAEDFTDFVFQRFGVVGFFLEAVQVGEQRLVDEVAQVVACHGGVVVDLAILALGRGPSFPAVGFVEQPSVFFAFQLGFHRLAVFQRVEVFEE